MAWKKLRNAPRAASSCALFAAGTATAIVAGLVVGTGAGAPMTDSARVDTPTAARRE
jgi:hypothetical protein